MVMDRSTMSYRKIYTRGKIGGGMSIPTIYQKNLQLHTIKQNVCDLADYVLAFLDPTQKAGFT